MITNRKNDMLNFQCCQPNRMTMAHTLHLALLLGHPLYKLYIYIYTHTHTYIHTYIHFTLDKTHTLFTRVSLFIKFTAIRLPVYYKIHVKSHNFLNHISTLLLWYPTATALCTKPTTDHRTISHTAHMNMH